MQYKCFFNSCKELPDVFCKCQGLPELMCEQHILNHYSKAKNKIHIHIPVFKQVEGELKDKSIDYLNDMIKLNKDIKKKLIELTEKFIKHANQIIKYFDELNRFLVFNIKQIKRYDRLMILAFDKADLTKDFHGNIIDVSELEALRLETSEKLMIEPIQRFFSTYSKNFQDLLNTLFEKSKIKFNMINYDKDQMYFFQKNTGVRVLGC